MNNSKISLGMLVMVLAFGLVLGGCPTEDNGGDDVIPSPWAGKYTGGDDTLKLNGNGTMSWTIKVGGNTITGSMSGVIIEEGGTVSLGGQNGTWVYIKTTEANTINAGSAGNVTIPAGRVGIVLQHALGESIATGKTGANLLMSDPQLSGAIWTPSPVTSTFPAAFYFNGDK